MRRLLLFAAYTSSVTSNSDDSLLVNHFSVYDEGRLKKKERKISRSMTSGPAIKSLVVIFPVLHVQYLQNEKIALILTSSFPISIISHKQKV